jgi:hypothetical protein
MFVAMGRIERSRPLPAEVYRQRLEERRIRASRLARREIWIANSRLVVFLTAAGLAWPCFISRTIAPIWIAAPLVVFVLFVIIHDRLIRARRRVELAADSYERGLARLEDRWMGNGVDGAGYLDKNHPYAVDFDLFGRGSLFELLCTATTGFGKQILARWLCSPADTETVRLRQESIEDLRDRIDLREDLAVLAGEACSDLDPESLERWCRAPRVFGSRLPRLIGRMLSVGAIAALVAWLGFRIGPVPLLLVVLLQVLLIQQMRRRIAAVIHGVERPAEALKGLATVLERLESETFAANQLRGLHTALLSGGTPPSRRIGRLGRLIEMYEWSRNTFFSPFAILTNWLAEFVYAIEDWRLRYGSAVPQWLATLGEVEALGSLSGYAYEHPEDPFPEIAEDGFCFEAEGIGHPMIPIGQCVRNDLSLGRENRVLVVSGSNMSGKSTLLRTVGTNAVLAFAGAPVRADKLRLSPLVVGASIRTIDSLQEGTSRFYAEIKRLRQLVDLTKDSRPLLFLIDEILHGTNSHDRRIGAEAVVRGMVERGAIGLMTTHDLALAEIVEDPALHAVNVHFEDRLEGDRIIFDYVLRSGVVRKSNALDLMRTVGLEV